MRLRYVLARRLKARIVDLRIAGRAWKRAGGGLFLRVRDRADGLDALGRLRRKLER